MKEYIYFDRQLVNSTLAQIDEGILTKLISGQSTTDSNQEEGGKEMTSETSGKASAAIVAAEGKLSQKEIDKFSSVYSKNNSELIETALDDYSLDILFQKLKIKNLHDEDLTKLSDGEFFLASGKLKVFNFEQLKLSVKKENLKNVLEEPKEVQSKKDELELLNTSAKSRIKHKDKIEELQAYIKENDPYSNYSEALKFANYASVLFPNTTLFKVNNLLAFCDTSSLRVNTPIMGFLPQTQRDISIFGIVIARRTKELTPEKGTQLEAVTIVSDIPVILTDVVLSSFDIACIGDYFVRPIAIYFDSE